MPLPSWKVNILNGGSLCSYNSINCSFRRSNSVLLICRPRMFASLLSVSETETIFLITSAKLALPLPRCGVPKKSIASVELYTSSISGSTSFAARWMTCELVNDLSSNHSRTLHAVRPTAFTIMPKRLSSKLSKHVPLGDTHLPRSVPQK